MLIIVLQRDADTLLYRTPVIDDIVLIAKF